MDLTMEASIISIGIFTSLVSLVAGGFLKGLDYISFVIALIPLALGRAIFGKEILDFTGLIYLTTIFFLAVFQFPIKFYPDLYAEFYLAVYAAVFGLRDSAVIGDLDSALAYEPAIACLIVLVLLQAYHRGYLSSITDLLTSRHSLSSKIENLS